jgi:hypothetical protein
MRYSWRHVYRSDPWNEKSAQVWRMRILVSLSATFALLEQSDRLSMRLQAAGLRGYCIGAGHPTLFSVS